MRQGVRGMSAMPPIASELMRWGELTRWRYIFLTEVPKNNYGKILKTRLREDFRPG
jgi:hypothetical protein